jgi:hypothetical protein
MMEEGEMREKEEMTGLEGGRRGMREREREWTEKE